jgi:hypothetical protein
MSMRSAIAIGLLLGVLAVASAVPANAASSSTVSDPVGDTARISGNVSAPAYLDIVEVPVTKQGGVFEFSMDLAAPVPNEPLLVSGAKQWVWEWLLDTDPTTFPTGYPRVPQLHSHPEFALIVEWDQGPFTAFIVDRRPTLTGGEPVFTPIEFSVNDEHVSVFVEAEIIDDPVSFGFRGVTRAWRGPAETEAFVNVDGAPNAAPDSPGYFVAWPS